MTGEFSDSVVPDLEEVATDEAFVDLVCADDDLVRAEFEAIVAASWVGPPPGPTLVPTPRPPERRPPRGEPPAKAKLPLTDPEASGPADGPRGRQRSPPQA
jgi:hypothetical protein